MIIVIGGGPAGRNAAIYLSMAGKEVTLVEKGGLSGIGGQCLHHGCMMVCGLNDAARILSAAGMFAERGIFANDPVIRYPQLISSLAEIQVKIAKVLDKETRDAGVSVIYGSEGRCEGRMVYIGNKEHEADAVICATGSHLSIPDIPGTDLDGVITPHTLPSLRELPSRLVIVGGGIMAAEFAFIFDAFGCEVHLLSRSAFLKNIDRNMRDIAIKELSGVRIYDYCTTSEINGNGRVESVSGVYSKEEIKIECDAVLLATGLVPSSGTLNGFKKGPDGRIIVDRRMETSVPGVYACGDLTGSPCLTPVARKEGIIAARNILGEDVTMDYDVIPQSMNLFSEFSFVSRDAPESISVAMPGPAGPGTFWSVPQSMTGMGRVFFNPADGKVTGVQSVAPAGGILTAYHTFLIENGSRVQDFDSFMEIHPMTDALYPLMKYASVGIKSGKYSKERD
jgi:Pyruvate/2-oxoglutarate dehydrogenase complex, dihydrolipoamide dehydrogenase (E3) component, and related enzymes